MNISLRLNLRSPTAESEAQRERVEAAAERKKAAKAAETVEQAWERILTMKNSPTDQERLLAVKHAMESGILGGYPTDGKRFSKAEALRLWAELNERQKADKLAEMVRNTPPHYRLVTDVASLEHMVSAIEAADIIAMDCETFGEDDAALDPWRGNMAGFSVSTRSESFYVPLNHVEKALDDAYVIDKMRGVLPNAKIVMHNAPFDCKWFYVKYGLDIIDALHADTRIMAMALDENRNHRLKDLCADWLKLPGDNFDQLFGKTPFNEIPLEVALVYAAGDTEKTLKLYDWIRGWYAKREDLRQIERLVFDIEMPVCRQFIRSDLRGIRFDVEMARELDAKFAEEEAQLETEIYRHLGEKINLNSPIQLSKKLYGDLRLPDHDKGSTGVRTLKRIKKNHPVIPLILDFRAVGKLRQAFTSKLPHNVKTDGKIHPWHNTWGAATGRFTCSNPKCWGIRR